MLLYFVPFFTLNWYKMIIKELVLSLPQIGKVEWIGLRPASRATLQEVDAVEAQTENGLTGDRYAGQNGKRQVTLIQAEHLVAAGAILQRGPIDPQLTRRNIVVSGINLLALKDQKFQIGEAILEMTGKCFPCQRMEENLGPGGYNAMRGHGGITARVIKGGSIKLGDEVSLFLE
jgi:MOSC domain-containing protein YiiM